MYLQELPDAAQACLKKKRFFLITSVDFGDAFDNAAHSKSLETLMGTLIDCLLARFACVGLMSRRFRLRLRSPTGQ